MDYDETEINVNLKLLGEYKIENKKCYYREIGEHQCNAK